MEKFTKLKSIPSYLALQNIDTDMIIPKQFLKTIKRTGLGKSLFYEMRYDENGKINGNFILNKDPYNKSKILIAGKNFGCGSSREHAPWALIDFGITCVISSSYADIFYNNCFKNGILPITINDSQVKEISEYAKRKEKISVNLEKKNSIIFLSIDDDGPGVDKSEFNNITKPFYKIDKSRSESKSSVGLGLSISSDIIKSHGGDIRFNKSKLGGLKVTISLPY